MLVDAGKQGKVLGFTATNEPRHLQSVARKTELVTYKTLL